MEVVILAGGSGTRLREQTEFIPKPLISIGGRPMIWHIMKLYAHHGFKDFVLALGYKQEAFKEYFSHFHEINNDITVDTGYFKRTREPHTIDHDNWRVTLSDTGINTQKGGRLKRIEKYITGDTFMMTYGDGIGDVDIQKLLDFHKSHGRIATVTGVLRPARFGEIHSEGDKVDSFTEKPVDSYIVINGGFFVFNKDIFKYLTTDEWCDLEIGPLGLLAEKRELMLYRHEGYWGCMDSLKDMEALNQLWDTGEAKWRVW